MGKVSQSLTGQRLGLWNCRTCYQTSHVDQARPARCVRCGSALHPRVPHSTRISACLLLAAAIFYIPANVLPVMHSQTLLGNEDDTILSGVLALLHSGSWPLALIVFLASIVVPCLKLASLAVLLDSVRRGSTRHPLQRSELYRLLERIGRWSMLDVYVIALLVALVQIRSLATIHVGAGALCFAAVVVLTMLATQAFDERLLWDELT